MEVHDFTFAQFGDCGTVCPPNDHVEGKKWGKTLALSPNFLLCDVMIAIYRVVVEVSVTFRLNCMSWGQRKEIDEKIA